MSNNFRRTAANIWIVRRSNQRHVNRPHGSAHLRHHQGWSCLHGRVQDPQRTRTAVSASESNRICDGMAVRGGKTGGNRLSNPYLVSQSRHHLYANGALSQQVPKCAREPFQVHTPNAYNGYQLTGGFFNRSVTLHIGDRYHVSIRQQFSGKDSYNYLKATVRPWLHAAFVDLSPFAVATKLDHPNFSVLGFKE